MPGPLLLSTPPLLLHDEVYRRTGEFLRNAASCLELSSPTPPASLQWCKPIGSIFEGGVEVANAVVRDDAVELLVSTKPINHRGDSLNGAHWRRWLVQIPAS